MISVLSSVECLEEKQMKSHLRRDAEEMLESNIYPKDKTYSFKKGEGGVKTFVGDLDVESEETKYRKYNATCYYEDKIVKYSSKEYSKFHIIHTEIFKNISRSQFDNYTYYEGSGCIIDESSSFYWFNNEESLTKLPIELRDCGLKPDKYSLVELKSKCNYKIPEYKCDNVYFFKVESGSITAYLTNDTENIQIYDFDKFETFAARSYSDIDGILSILPQPSSSLIIFPSMMLLLMLMLLLI